MLISDWSSDVCSSDLHQPRVQQGPERIDHQLQPGGHGGVGSLVSGREGRKRRGRLLGGQVGAEVLDRDFLVGAVGLDVGQERKSVVEGKSVSVRVDIGGRRISKKKKIRNK